MIEAAIINVLRSDPQLVALVGTFNGAPSMFSDEAPEGAAVPFIVVTISRSPTDHKPAQDFSINVDFYDYQKSRANSRAASERIEFILDDQIIQSDRYGDIRIRFFSGAEIPGNDPRDVHYNSQFQARGIRNKFVNTTK